VKPGSKAKYSLEDVRRMREMLDRGLSQDEVARAYGASQSTVSRLISTYEQDAVERQSWTWDDAVADPEGFMALWPNSLQAMRAQLWIEETYFKAHRADHPHDDRDGEPLRGFGKRCDHMWDEFLQGRAALQAAYDARWHQ
jgi:hypothetical protein